MGLPLHALLVQLCLHSTAEIHSKACVSIYVSFCQATLCPVLQSRCVAFAAMCSRRYCCFDAP
jgi:hypothetical protein